MSYGVSVYLPDTSEKWHWIDLDLRFATSTEAERYYIGLLSTQGSGGIKPRVFNVVEYEDDVENISFEEEPPRLQRLTDVEAHELLSIRNGTYSGKVVRLRSIPKE